MTKKILHAFNKYIKELFLFRLIIIEAGLGLIDIARKSGSKFAYEIREEDQKYSYFTLETTINLK